MSLKIVLRLIVSVWKYEKWLVTRVNLCLEVFETTNITLETPKKVNQKDYKKQPDIFRKTTKKTKLCSHNCVTNS